MDRIIETPEIDEFLAGPLVTWFTSCLDTITDERLTYNNLVDGYLLHNVFLQMNLHVHTTNVYPSTLDSAAWRTHNLLAVLDNVRHFYEDELGQAILCSPDVEQLGREPECHVPEIEVLLGLLLGCAVQCPKKGLFIDAITRLDKASQLAVAECISQVIEVPGIVLGTEMLTDHEHVPRHAQRAVDCVRRVCRERDDYKAQLRRRQEHEEDQLSDDYRERLKLKFEATSLEDQLRQRSDELEVVQVELRESEMKLRELTEVHEKLRFGATNVQLYRDELDEANEKVERLEREVARYEKKLVDFDACKARLKHLEKANVDLTMNQAVLEKKAELQKGEWESSRDSKRRLIKLTEQVSNLTAEILETRDKYLRAREENNELQRLVKEYNKQPRLNHRCPDGIPSVQDVLLLNQANARIDKLQVDNESLTSYLEILKKKLFDKSDVIAALEKENKKLLGNCERQAKRNQHLQSVLEKVSQSLRETRKRQNEQMEHIRALLQGKGVDEKNLTVPATRRAQNPIDARSRNPLKYVKTES